MENNTIPIFKHAREVMAKINNAELTKWCRNLRGTLPLSAALWYLCFCFLLSCFPVFTFFSNVSLVLFVFTFSLFACFHVFTLFYVVAFFAFLIIFLLSIFFSSAPSFHFFHFN
jgi:hypothetical protein